MSMSKCKKNINRGLDSVMRCSFVVEPYKVFYGFQSPVRVGESLSRYCRNQFR